MRFGLTFLTLVLAAGALASPAAAQYYERDYYRRPPPRYYHDGYREPPYGYYRRERRYGRLCVTSRGTCVTAPGPVGVSCRCHIPGFGRKRGSIQ